MHRTGFTSAWDKVYISPQKEIQLVEITQRLCVCSYKLKHIQLLYNVFRQNFQWRYTATQPISASILIQFGSHLQSLSEDKTGGH